MNDALLKPYLDERLKEKPERLLQKLYEIHLQSIVRPIVWSILKRQSGIPDLQEEALEVEAEVVAVLFPRICKIDPARKETHIPNLSGYCARVAYRCSYHYLGKKFPLRVSATRCLKYLLNETQGLDCWEREGQRFLCGFTVWKDKGKKEEGSERIQQALADPADFSLQAFPDESPQYLYPALLMKRVFDWFGHPLLLEEAVTLFMNLRGVLDESSLSLDEMEIKGFEPISTDADPATLIQAQGSVQHIWQLICCLRSTQRASLLLDWKEIKEGPVQILMLTGGIPLVEIADALAMPATRLSGILFSLPWKDDTIAKELNTTEGVVRNFRSSASKRLRCQLQGPDFSEK